MQEEKEILIVEDSEETVVFLEEILETNGYRHRVAHNGQEAMAAMKQKRPDLVLLDIMMPRKTGLGVLKDMKREEPLQGIPVILVTGASEVTGVDIRSGSEQPKESYDDDFARSYGARLHEIMKDLPSPDGFIEKPIDPPVLVQKIKEVLG